LVIGNLTPRPQGLCPIKIFVFLSFYFLFFIFDLLKVAYVGYWDFRFGTCFDL